MSLTYVNSPTVLPQGTAGLMESKNEAQDAAQAETNMTKAEFEAEASKPMASLDSKEEADMKEIRELYTRFANEPDHDYGWAHGPENARSLGYKPEWIDDFPKSVFESNAAGGCPFTLGDIFEGATVVDFGCGAGVSGPWWDRRRLPRASCAQRRMREGENEGCGVCCGVKRWCQE